MARITLHPQATTTRVLDTVRETFEARGYRWEQQDSDRAVASEGGTTVSDWALPLSHRLRVAIQVKPGKGRLVLSQETVGAAMTGAAVAAGGGPWLHVQLSFRFGKVVKAVRADLSAAALC